MHTLDRDRDWALFVRAEGQHATVAHRQLVALGFSRHAIAHLVERRHLRVVHRGVYAVGPARPTREARWMAAVLAVGPGAVLSHRSAAALWRLLADDGREVEVTVERRLRDRDGIRVRSGRLPTDEVITVDGIRVTTVARTILDLAGLLPRPRLERVIDDAQLRQLADSTSLRTLLQRYPRRRGVGIINAILADYVAATITREEFEACFLAFLIANSLPRALVNHHIPPVGECDFVWPEARLIVELDGYSTHGTRRSFEADRARDRALHVAGWRVIRITWRQLRDEPKRLAADLRALLGV
ncbi:hypothetical protein BH20ACT17_BH20ACT17_15680 [soil metagenome]